METPVPSSAKDTLRAIKILFYAIAAGLVMFALIVFGLSFFQKPPLTNKVISRIFIVAVLFLVIICFLVGSRLYKKKMVAAQSPALALKDKLDIYRSALTSYLAFYEGAGLRRFSGDEKTRRRKTSGDRVVQGRPGENGVWPFVPGPATLPPGRSA